MSKGGRDLAGPGNDWDHAMIIDSHVHAWADHTPLSLGRDYTPSHASPVDALLVQMDAHGVDGAVLVQPSFLGTDNGYLLGAIRDHPDRFRGVAVVAPQTGEAELEDLRAAGVAGLRFNLTHGAAPDFRSDALQALLARTVAADLHVQLHLDAAQLPDVLSPVRAAGCRIVVDHFGRPSPALGADDPAWAQLIDLGAAGPHVVKLSAPYRLAGVDPAALAGRLLAAFGAERLVWGSDFPWTRFEAGRSYRQCLDWIALWAPESADRSRILGPSAAALYRFPGAG